jgi:hypothetical protein
MAAELAPLIAQRLLEAAKRRGTEADFRREAARILEDAGAAAGLTIVPRDEFSVARGRVDSVYNRLILEYKRPGILKADNEGRSNQDVIQQVKDYILDVGKRERREAQRLAGVATDGLRLIFVRRVGDGWSVDDPIPVTAASIERFLRLLFSLSAGAALVPENLVEDFGPRTLRAQRAVRSLYTALHSTKEPLVNKLFEQWQLFFSEATDYKSWENQIESREEFRTFVKGMGLQPQYAEAPKVFFALHTYYALLIKLVASLAAARFAGGDTQPLSTLASLKEDQLRGALADLERGGLFRQYGIRNFLEGDFFGWYLIAWDHDIEDAVARLIQRLAEYDPGALELAPENARDLLKKLYHYLLPREIRHDLGEYYTPDWLAERLINETVTRTDYGNPDTRILDPACGSGTFLVTLIKIVKLRAIENKDNPQRILECILRNISGFDLNPLAVIAARTNYLLALGDLLQHRTGDIDIPVYQADSVMTPSQGTDLFDGNVYLLKTSVGVFRVPQYFAEQQRMDMLTNVLDEAVESRLGSDAFLHRLGKTVRIPGDQLEAVAADLSALYEQLQALHDQGLNGVWARIIKNAFAPLFLEPVDYVIGNPPWVNWNNLPDEYRRSSMDLWRHYGLFPKRTKALETILGAGSYDISMLMTYVSLDRYLRKAGRLGFVLSLSLFKTVSAGQGFRRFLLPDGTAIGAMAAEDFTDLKPFEGATNRTAIAILVKGRKTQYPVPFKVWKRRGSGRSGTIDFDTPYEEVISAKAYGVNQYAEPVDGSDVTSAWLTASKNCLGILRKIWGQSAYTGRIGIKCGVNGIYWMSVHGTRPGGIVIAANVTEGSKKKVQATQAALESDLIFPLVRGGDVARWSATPEISVLVTHHSGMRLKAIPEKEMKAEFPKAWAYLAKFEKVLRGTGLYRRYFKETDPFYSMFNIGDYTFADHKVLVREIAGGLIAAVVGTKNGKPCIPDHKLMLVSCESAAEAHYLCAVLNSSPSRLFVESYVLNTQFSPQLFTQLRVPQFSSKNHLHVRLSECSQRLHRLSEKGDAVEEIRSIEATLDSLVGKLWGLTERELTDLVTADEIQHS